MITLNRDIQHEAGLHDLMPDLTPMLDILFILLVFFMLTAGAVHQSIEVSLPSSVKEVLTQVNTPKHIILEIQKNQFVVDGKAIASLELLKKTISTLVMEKPDYPIVIAGDKEISMQRLLSVLTFLQSQGIATANILMQEERSE